MTDPEFNFQIHREGQTDKRYVWSLKGPSGGIHIWAQFRERDRWGDRVYGGVECHYMKKPYDGAPDEAPIKDCWLTGCDCWPDGSSLYFDERLRPMVEMAEDNPEGLTEYMNSEMLDWYREKLSRGDFAETHPSPDMREA